MSKRSFAVDTTSLSTEKPTLDNGLYAGVIRNATTSIGQDNTIAVVKKKVWNKNAKVMEETDEYIIGGRFQYGATLTSKKASKLLQRDEPVVFGGQIFLNFDESFKLANSYVLGAFLTALGLHEVNFSESVDWDYDENIEVPEELQSVPQIVEMLNSVAYHRALFDLIANTVNLQPALVKVVKQPNYKTPEVLENVIDRGTASAPFCGILPYVEGSENDLDEE